MAPAVTLVQTGRTVSGSLTIEATQEFPSIIGTQTTSVTGQMDAKHLALSGDWLQQWDSTLQSGPMPRACKYSPELRERAVRMVFEQEIARRRSGSQRRICQCGHKSVIEATVAL